MPSEVLTSEHCDKHGDYQAKSIRVFSKTLKTQCPWCAEEKKTEKERIEMRQQQLVKAEKVNRLLGESGIPRRFIGRNFNNYRAEIPSQQQALNVSKLFSEKFDTYLETGASLIFCGKPGTGKTHLAAAIANAVCEQGRIAIFMSVLKATRLIKETWRKDSESTEHDAYRGLVEPDLLILDEVGVQFGSDAEKLILFEILNGRYENFKPTIVISNLSPSEISAYLGERVVDRLREGGGSVVVFNWESYRDKVLGDSDLPRNKTASVL